MIEAFVGTDPVPCDRGGSAVRTFIRSRGVFRSRADQEALRLAAINAIVALAGPGEDRDVVAESLLVLGVSSQEMTAAILGEPI
jgi:hypothetical protein